LVLHVASAFHHDYAWSSATAYRATARRTAEVYGLDWGGGLFVNYAVVAGWIADVAWWWWAGLASYRHRPWALVVTWHALLLIVVFNGAFVFVEGPLRWIGFALCLVVVLAWSIAWRRRH
jgi:Ca2+/Na+ antiporter